MRSPHQKKEIHFIGSGQLRKSISKKTVKKRANAKPHQMRPSSHFRRCSAAAQSRTDLRWRTQTLAIRTGCKLWSKADVEKNCLDWPSLRQPWQFCSSLPSAQSGRLSHLSDVNTWTQSLTQKGFKLLLLNTIMCSGQTSSIPRRTFHLRSRAGSRGTAQCWRLIWIRMTRHIEVPKKHGRKLNYISYNHIHKTTYIIWNDMMYQSARETEEKAGPCNLVHPRRPRSRPCHRTWGERVS